MKQKIFGILEQISMAAGGPIFNIAHLVAWIITLLGLLIEATIMIIIGLCISAPYLLISIINVIYIIICECKDAE